jgi:CubicO group peptidase (beta-lactamase class C family)
MNCFSVSHMAVLSFFIFLLACHSDSQQVSARTKNASFPEKPIPFIHMPLIYDTLSPQTQAIISELDKFYATQVRAGFNGSVLIGYQGRIIYERYFGYSNYEQHIPLTTTSADQLASVSKTFTAGAILYLHQHKYLDIEQPVKNYIKDFPYPEITIKMLLNHRSGIIDYTKWLPLGNQRFNDPVSNDLLVDLINTRKPKLEFAPDRHFKYCNTNYAILAKLIEEVTQMSYPEFMNVYIFRPLGMDHTFVYNPAEGLPFDAAISYANTWRREPDMFADGIYGDKNIYSTVEDMYRWDQSFYNNRLLRSDIVEMAYAPYSFEKPGIKNYGLGWRMFCFPNGSKLIFHNGWWHGNNTSFYRFVKDNLTIIVLGNRFTKSIYQHAPRIFTIIKGVPVQAGMDADE